MSERPAWAVTADDADEDAFAVDAGLADEDPLEGSMLRYQSITEVTTYLRSPERTALFTKVGEYGSDSAKNTITKDDEEHEFLLKCSRTVLEIEVEKTKVNKFLCDHYAVRFPELPMLIPDSVALARSILAIGNRMDIAAALPELQELLPSQIIAAVVAAASTTQGRDLSDTELTEVREAATEMMGLEDGKQLILGYSQARMVLLAPNLSAFLGTGITSQLFAIAGSLTSLTRLDAADIMVLGSQRGTTSGFKLRTAGFLVNVDMVACQPPELRMRAMRIVAAETLNLARIDDNRRAADNSAGLQARQQIKEKMLTWTDPLVQQLRRKSLANRTYEKRLRKRGAEAAIDPRRGLRGE